MMKKMMKKILPLFLIVTMLLSGCSKEPEVLDYESAIEWLEQSKPDADGKYVVTEQLVFALQNTQYKEPKNIIYMIGDGMGANIIQATQEKYASELYGNKLAINYLTNVGTQSTYSASNQITDSGAGGTALATGKKTSNYTIGMNPEHTENYKSVLELAAEKGKSTGIVVTKSVTDATPATFTAHVEDRLMQNEIAKQQLLKIADGTLDLVLGGGSEYYEYFDNDAAFEQAEENGMSYSERWEDTLDDSLPLVGLYANDALMTSSAAIPTLAEMTELALSLLSEDENGFFLMIEGSQIDTMGHDNDLEKEIYEMSQFDYAIAVAMKYVALHPDTVLIITADHETGGLYFPKEGYGNGENYKYLYDEHSCINVPVYALGYGIEELDVIKENTDIAGFVASILGEEDFAEKKSVVTNLYDGQSQGALEFSFDASNTSVELFGDDLAGAISSLQNVRAIHMTVSNKGAEKVTLPALKIQMADGAIYEAIPQYAYIDAGETLELTYVLPMELWETDAFANVTDIYLTYDVVAGQAWKTVFGYGAEEAELEISEIAVTERELVD